MVEMTLVSAVPSQASWSRLSILLLGFALGMRHATDSDHVVAVSTLVSRESGLRRAAWLGALWGAGHTLTILAVGIAILLFTLVIPARIGLGMEFTVGVMLVMLGCVNLVGNRRQWESQQPGKSGLDKWLRRSEATRWFRPFAVGLVHGLAGSAAVALLVLATLRDKRWAVAYLALFGLGTIAGMMVITVGMASALRHAASRFEWLHTRLSLITGVASVAFGLFLIYQMGFQHGLFTSHPVWTPE
jgi:high-affinity nickel permease